MCFASISWSIQVLNIRQEVPIMQNRKTRISEHCVPGPNCCYQVAMERNHRASCRSSWSCRRLGICQHGRSWLVRRPLLLICALFSRGSTIPCRFEYLLWCEDVGMEPILAVWSGMATSPSTYTPIRDDTSQVTLLEERSSPKTHLLLIFSRPLIKYVRNRLSNETSLTYSL